MGENDLSAWDDHNNEQNIVRHKIDFARPQSVFEGCIALVREDDRRDCGERRPNMIVELNGVILNVTFIDRPPV